MSLRRPVTAVTLGFGIALTIPFLASAHNSGASANCNGITTSLNNFENAAGDRVYTSIDGTLVDTFNGPFVTTTHTVPVPQDGIAHTWQVVVDSVSGNGTQYDATYNGAVGPCGEVQTTTTVAETTTTELVTTTTEQGSTTSTSTVNPTSTTSSSEPSTTSSTPTTTLPSTSSSVATTSTTSPQLSTTSTSQPTPTEPSTTPPTTSSSTPPPECSDNPNTPQDDCAPVCTPVTQPDGTNSCGPSLPPTGLSDWTIGLIPAAAACILCGAAIILFNRRGIQR